MLTQHEDPGLLINSDKIQGPATQVKILGARELLLNSGF